MKDNQIMPEVGMKFYDHNGSYYEIVDEKADIYLRQGPISDNIMYLVKVLRYVSDDLHDGQVRTISGKTIKSFLDLDDRKNYRNDYLRNNEPRPIIGQ